MYVHYIQLKSDGHLQQASLEESRMRLCYLSSPVKRENEIVHFISLIKPDKG